MLPAIGITIILDTHTISRSLSAHPRRRPIVCQYMDTAYLYLRSAIRARQTRRSPPRSNNESQSIYEIRCHRFCVRTGRAERCLGRRMRLPVGVHYRPPYLWSGIHTTRPAFYIQYKYFIYIDMLCVREIRRGRPAGRRDDRAQSMRSIYPMDSIKRRPTPTRQARCALSFNICLSIISASLVRTASGGVGR